MSVEMLGQVGMQSGLTGKAVPSMSPYGSLHTKDEFAAAVEAGRCFAVCNQVGVASQAGLSLTTPVLTLANPAGSGVTGRLWYAGYVNEVVNGAAATAWLAVGTNTIAAAVTGTLTTTHRNLKLGSAGIVAGAQGNRIVPFLAATLPGVPVGLFILGVGLTGAITTVPNLDPSGRLFNGSVLIQPGDNISIQFSTATGALSTSCEYIWEECNLVV